MLSHNPVAGAGQNKKSLDFPKAIRLFRLVAVFFHGLSFSDNPGQVTYLQLMKFMSATF